MQVTTMYKNVSGERTGFKFIKFKAENLRFFISVEQERQVLALHPQQALEHCKRNKYQAFVHGPMCGWWLKAPPNNDYALAAHYRFESMIFDVVERVNMSCTLPGTLGPGIDRGLSFAVDVEGKVLVVRGGYIPPQTKPLVRGVQMPITMLIDGAVVNLHYGNLDEARLRACIGNTSNTELFFARALRQCSVHDLAVACAEYGAENVAYSDGGKTDRMGILNINNQWVVEGVSGQRSTGLWLCAK